MHWRNLCLIFIILCSSALPTISDSSYAEKIEEIEDAPENIPGPFETHEIIPITLNACEPIDCALNSFNSESLQIDGEF